MVHILYWRLQNESELRELRDKSEKNERYLQSSKRKERRNERRSKRNVRQSYMYWFVDVFVISNCSSSKKKTEKHAPDPRRGGFETIKCDTSHSPDLPRIAKSQRRYMIRKRQYCYFVQFCIILDSNSLRKRQKCGQIPERKEGGRRGKGEENEREMSIMYSGIVIHIERMEKQMGENGIKWRQQVLKRTHQYFGWRFRQLTTSSPIRRFALKCLRLIVD